MNIYACDAVCQVKELFRDAPISDFATTFDLLEAHSTILLEAHRAQNEVVKFQIGSWHPTLVGKPIDEILAASFSLDDARATIAREFGFKDFENAKLESTEFDQSFETCVDLVLAGEIEKLAQRLNSDSGLVRQTSSFGHRATLLNYLGSNGV